MRSRDMLLSGDARKVQAGMNGLADIFDKPAEWQRKDQRAGDGPEQSLARSARQAKRRLRAALQGSRRNEPEQLWETTLDENGVLLQVKVKSRRRRQHLLAPDG
ncbi:MAG: hypothetical protein R3C58_05375 [Parvularculaceae bacterium]